MRQIELDVTTSDDAFDEKLVREDVLRSSPGGISYTGSNVLSDENEDRDLGRAFVRAIAAWNVGGGCDSLTYKGYTFA